MKRKDFLKRLGLVSAGSTLTGTGVYGKPVQKAMPPNACVLIPTETEGPFPLDLTANATYFRTNLKEDRTGTPLNVKIKILGSNNCLPMQNVRVNIWHCDKDGLYSGYDVQNNAGQAGKTYLRGYQLTDANGLVEFQTIFPGWYSGRICHIHFQAYISASYRAVSQLTFPIATKNAIYAAASSLYTRGADPMTLASDNIFSDGYVYQMATLTANASGGYDCYLEVTISGSGISSLPAIEAGGQFTLGQNFPNPFMDETNVPFTLHYGGEVQLDLWEITGRKVATIPVGKLDPGTHKIVVNWAKLGLTSQNYAYQLQVVTHAGTFRQVKLMTAK